MRFFYNTSLLLILLAVVISCQKSSTLELDSIHAVNDSIKKIYAPDKRVAIYKLEFNLKNNELTVSGETDQEAALKDLIETLSKKGFNN